MNRPLIACLLAGVAALPAVAQEAPYVLPEITLEAESDTTLVQDGYVPGTSRTATKLDTPVGRIPQAVTIVTQDQIEDQAPRTLNEALGYTAAANPNNYGFDTRFDAFSCAGFRPITTAISATGCANTARRPPGSSPSPTGWKGSRC